MAADGARNFVPLTCHGHSRPVPHISFSNLEKDGQYFMVSACKGMMHPSTKSCCLGLTRAKFRWKYYAP